MVPLPESSWPAVASIAISAVLAIPAIGSFLYTIGRDRSPRARMKEKLETAQQRLGLLERSLTIGRTVLVGEELSQAQGRAWKEANHIERDTRIAIEILSMQKSARWVIGVSAWRKMLAFYKPVTRRPGLSIVLRIVYISSLLMLVLSLTTLFVEPHGQLAQEFIYAPFDPSKMSRFINQKQLMWIAAAISAVNTITYRRLINRESWPMAVEAVSSKL
jgi:hypothetical protein